MSTPAQNPAAQAAQNKPAAASSEAGKAVASAPTTAPAPSGAPPAQKPPAPAPKPAAPQSAPSPKVENKPAPPSPAAPAVPNPKPGAPAAVKPLESAPPIPAKARLKTRHRGLLLTGGIGIFLPLLLAAFYLWVVAADQYASQAGFTVRQEESAGSASSLIGGLAQFTGSGGARDSDILYEFIRSQQVVQAVDERINLREIYGRNWPWDPVFALSSDATIEDLLSYWQRMVRVSYDQSSGLIELRVLAFSPQEAKKVAEEIVQESQTMINALNASAREDVTRHALHDLDVALKRLKSAREALTQFRTRTQILDPATDIQSQMGVLANLQQQLAQSLIDYDLVLETATVNDPRVLQAARRIEAIRMRITDERRRFATGSEEDGRMRDDYPSLIAEYESLAVDREFAEETYRAALASVDIARAQASRQTRYLAAYISPTLPERAEYPQRWILLGMMGLFLGMTWSIVVLVYYSIRDRR